MTTPVSRGQLLAAQAAEAAEVRHWETHPDVVALQVERTRARVDQLIWAGIVTGLAFTAVNVQQFAAHTIGAGPGTLGWWSAWLLDPTIAAVLLGILIAERRVAPGQIVLEPVAQAAKWALLAATYVMNTWASWAAGSVAGVVLHSVPPLVVFTAAEVMPGLHDRLTQYVYRARDEATAWADRTTQTERSTQAVPPVAEGAGSHPRTAAPGIPVTGPLNTQRSAPHPVAPAGDDPAGARGGPTSQASGTPQRETSPTSSAAHPAHRGRTAGRNPTQDMGELVAAARALGDGNPSRREIARELGISEHRARQILTQLRPVGEPVLNGAARG